MKKSLFYFILLAPIFFLSYYFFKEKNHSKEIFNFKPEINEKSSFKILLYSKDNLYDYLNGGAEKILSYGFNYLKLWQGNENDFEFYIELYNFNLKDGAKKMFIDFSTNKSSNYEIIEDQGICFSNSFFLKISTYPANKNFIEKNIKKFMEYSNGK